MGFFQIKRKMSFVPALVLSAAVLFGGCGSEAPEEVILASVETPQPVESYMLSFYAGDELLEEYSADAGEAAEFPKAPEMEGLRFLHWVNDRSEKVDPSAETVSRQVSYTAVYAPVLDRHVPYLYADDNGLLHPDDVLDNTELVAALGALADEAAKNHFPQLPETGGAVSAASLRTSLSYFYTGEELEAAFAGLSEEENITKSAFARVMNLLLGRGNDGGTVISEDALFFPDVPRSRSDYEDIMEAAVAHDHMEGAEDWQEAELGPRYEEGFTLIGGSLYCVDAEGFFISDTVIGSLTFGYDGRYTSGDATLDSYVTGVLSDLAYAHPGADRMELLRAAFDYTRDSFTYLRRNIYNIGHSGWEIADAVTMFETSRGNCYSYTAVFWALARGLGYEAKAISGTIGRDYEPHGWVEIEIEGTNYYFDPETEMAYNRDGVYSKDMFMMGWVYASGWFYYKG